MERWRRKVVVVSEVGQTNFAGKEFRDDRGPQRHHEQDIRDSNLKPGFGSGFGQIRI